jgi:hypothetical protein
VLAGSPIARYCMGVAAAGMVSFSDGSRSRSAPRDQERADREHELLRDPERLAELDLAVREGG